MRKRLFLIVAMVAILCCLFAIGASAASVEVNGVYYTTKDTTDFEGFDGTATVNTSNKTSTTAIATIPDSITVDGKTYIVNAIDSSAFSGNQTVSEIRILSKYITKIPYGMISGTHGGALSKIFIDFSNITQIDTAGLNPSSDTKGNNPQINAFYYYDAKAFIADGSVVKITNPDFSNVTKFADAALQGAQFEKLVVPAGAEISSQCFRMIQASEIVIKGDRTSIPNYSFAHCRNVRKAVVESRNLQTVGSNAFSFQFQKVDGVYPSCDFYIDMSKVKKIDGSAFIFSSGYDHGITTIQWYDLEGNEFVDLSSVETLGDSCFASSNLGSADHIKWPTGLKSISNQVFRLCNINQVLVLNAAEGSTIALPFWAFAGNTFTGIVLGKNVTESSATFPNATFAVVLADSFKANDKNFVSSSTPVYCKEITINTAFDMRQIATGTILNYGLCGAGAEVLFPDTSSLVLGTFSHTENEGAPTVPSCTTPSGTQYNCVICGAFIRYEETAPAPGHTYDADNPDSIEPLSCTTNEVKHYTCSVCAENFKIVTAYAAGHRYTVISYPVVSTDGVEGTKRFTCSNFDGACGDYYEYAYRMLPDELDVRIEMNDGTKLVLKSKNFWKYKTLEVDNTYSCWLYNGSLYSSFVVGDITYKTSDVKSVSVPYGITKIEQNFTSGYPNIKIIDLTDARDVQLPSTFRDNGNITEVILGDGVKLMGDSFRYINSLSILRIANGASVVFPSNVCPFTDFRGLDKIIIGDSANVRFERNTTFNWNGSTTRRLSEIIIGDNATVYFGYRTFNGENNLATITFGENGNYTFAAECLQGAPLTALNIPVSSTVTFEGNAAFKNCTSLESVWLPASVTEIKKETFYGCTALNKVVLMGATSIGESAFNATSDVPLTIYAHAKGDLVFGSNALANRASVVLYTNSSNVTSLSNASYTIYAGIAHPYTPHTEAETCFENGYIGYATVCPCKEIAYGASYTVYTNESTEGTAFTLDDIIIIDEFDGHDFVLVIAYDNGFTKNGLKTSTCSRCEEKEFEDTAVLPIFTPVGFSYRDISDGIGGLSAGFKVDLVALKEFTEANKDTTTLSVTMFIVNPKYLDGNGALIVNKNLNASKGAIQVNINDIKYSTISCSINGFDMSNSELTGLELVVGAYVTKTVTDENGTITTIEMIQKDYTEEKTTPVKSILGYTDFSVYSVTISTVLSPAAQEATPAAYSDEE